MALQASLSPTSTMPLKTVPNVDSPAVEPRRSERIASKPGVTAVTETKKESKKRLAEKATSVEAGDDPSSLKKAKSEGQEVAIEEENEKGVLSPIDIGSNLPVLVLKNEKGEDVQVSDLAAESGVVLFLIPKADTSGCTVQACGFRDIYPDFTSSGYTVYCLSADSPDAQTKWQTKKELPYPLISDPERILISALGANENGKTKRSHFIFEKGGKLVNKQIPVKPTDSPKLALEFILDFNNQKANL